MDPLEIGEPGWAGDAVILLALRASGPRRIARAALGPDGAVVTDDPQLADQWAAAGIVGRAHQGRLYPHDGQEFLDELPFVYRGAALRAVPAESVL